MSRAVITYADPANNEYNIRIPGYSIAFRAQCVTMDELEVGDEVMMADIDNLPPHEAKTKGFIRILPSRGNYTYSIDSRWYKASEIKALGHQASLMYSYIYSSDMNPSWQKERPLYRKGTIRTIHDAKYVDVEITYPWRGGVTETKRCRVDYMTCDTVAFAVGDVVLVKFVNSDPRRPYVVGKWNDPSICNAYLYCALKVDDRVTSVDLGGGITSESSESSTSSSSSQDSKSSESASSYSEGIKGLDDYYAFVWDPVVNDFAVINDSVTGEVISFPCRAERLEQWLLDSMDVTQVSMTNRKAGQESISAGAGFGVSKRWFVQGNWDNFISEIGRNQVEVVIGGTSGYYLDDASPNEDCDSPGDCTESYWTDGPASYSGPPWYIFAKCGSFDSGLVYLTNPLTGGSDVANYQITRTCTAAGGDERELIAGSSINAVLIPDSPNHGFFSSYIHTLDGWEINTITTEDYNYSNDNTNGQVDAEYATSTFLGTLHSAVQIREYEYSPTTYIAKAFVGEKFIIGRRCAAGTFAWLGLQGAVIKAQNYDPSDIHWAILDKHNYAVAYCDSGGYGTDPFTSKSDNTRISDAIKQMIDRFYEEDAGGAILDFGVDVRWVSGPTGSYSSISSSSISSSSSSSSSESVSKESSSSSSLSSRSSQSSSSEA